MGQVTAVDFIGNASAAKVTRSRKALMCAIVGAREAREAGESARRHLSFTEQGLRAQQREYDNAVAAIAESKREHAAEALHMLKYNAPLEETNALRQARLREETERDKVTACEGAVALAAEKVQQTEEAERKTQEAVEAAVDEVLVSHLRGLVEETQAAQDEYVRRFLGMQYILGAIPWHRTNRSANAPAEVREAQHIEANPIDWNNARYKAIVNEWQAAREALKKDSDAPLP